MSQLPVRTGEDCHDSDGGTGAGAPTTPQVVGRSLLGGYLSGRRRMRVRFGECILHQHNGHAVHAVHVDHANHADHGDDRIGECWVWKCGITGNGDPQPDGGR